MSDFQIHDGQGVKIIQAVIAECERCHERSRPLDPQQVEGWTKNHMAVHEMDDLVVEMEAKGHKIGENVDWFDQDDSSGNAYCSCGWRGRSGKAVGLRGKGIQHLLEVKKAEETPPPPPPEKTCYCGKPESVCVDENGSHCHHPFARAHMWGDG